MAVSKVLIIVGVLLIGIGVVISYAPWLMNWFGKLPGDIYIKNEHSTIYIPVTSMIVISLVLTFAINLFFRK